MSKYLILFLFYNEFKKSNSLNPYKEHTKQKKKTVYNNASELYNEYLEIYFHQYMALPDAKKKESWVINMILKN